VEAVPSLSVEVTRNQQLAISQRGVLAYSWCTSFTSRMFHSFLISSSYLPLLTSPCIHHSSFFVSSSKRPSTFLSVIQHIISSLLTFPSYSLSPFSTSYSKYTHTHTHTQCCQNPQTAKFIGPSVAKESSLQQLHPCMLPSGSILKRKFHATDGLQNKQTYKKWYMFRPKRRGLSYSQA